MVLRRLPSVAVEPPVVVAIGAFVVGVIDIVSSVTPALTDRLNLFQAMLPMDAGDLAGSVTFASGVALVWLSGGLARRKRRAWLAALGVITFAAAAHLADGFDIEEAIGSLVLLVALLRLRRWFDAPGDPTSLRPLVAGLGVALVAWAIVGSAASDHLNRITDLGFELVLAAGAFWALHQWLRASDRWLEIYRARGMRAFPSGDEAVLDPTRFSLDGRAIRKVRQSVTRLERAGFAFRVAAPDDLSEAERYDVDAVTREWLGGAVDRGFSMAMDDLHSHPQARFALATDASGRVRGYLHLVPSGRGYSLSAMRRGRDTPNGLMEYLIVRTTLWAAPEGVEELSLNFSAFADVLRADRAAPMRLRFTRAVLLRLDRFFQLERLFSFNRKFHPTWRTRYICFERAIDVPVLSLPTLHAERLIGPPRRFPARRR